MFWKLEEGRLVQERTVTSAANADTVWMGQLVPEGKCWVVIGYGYKPSVAETQLVSIEKVTKPGSTTVVLNPISVALNPSSLTFIEQGMEYLLLPGEYILARRADHTAGSTMTIVIQAIEIDLPLYTYEDPQEVKRQKRVTSIVRSQLGGALGAGTRTFAPADRGDRGGRTGPLPK